MREPDEDDYRAADEHATHAAELVAALNESIGSGPDLRSIEAIGSVSALRSKEFRISVPGLGDWWIDTGAARRLAKEFAAVADYLEGLGR